MVDETREVIETNDHPQVNVGDTLTGKVAKIEEKQALLDVDGFKYTAILPISEVSNIHIEKISDVLNIGDEIKVAVKKFNPDKDELVVSKRTVDAGFAWDELARKKDSGEVFEAKVAEVVKGGLVVDVGLRGFVPASQVELNYVEDFSDYKGKTLKLKVIELDRDNNRVILSQKAVLEEELQKQKDDLFNRIQEGSVIEGSVQRLTD